MFTCSLYTYGNQPEKMPKLHSSYVGTPSPITIGITPVVHAGNRCTLSHAKVNFPLNIHNFLIHSQWRLYCVSLTSCCCYWLVPRMRTVRFLNGDCCWMMGAVFGQVPLTTNVLINLSWPVTGGTLICLQCDILWFNLWIAFQWCDVVVP